MSSKAVLQENKVDLLVVLLSLIMDSQNKDIHLSLLFVSIQSADYVFQVHNFFSQCFLSVSLKLQTSLQTKRILNVANLIS